MEAHLERKLTGLEEALMELAYVQQKSEMGLIALQREMREFKNEMRDFKNEMLEFKDEMKEFKDEMKEFKDEMKEFKDEMKEFKDEMEEFKEWSKKNIEWSKNQIKEMNKQWGHLANKLGTIVEDIIFPATKPILKKYFNCIPDWLGMNIYRKNLDLQGEFDVVALCNNNVFLIEVKATPKIEYINDFIEKKVPLFRQLFEEYKDKNLILIFGSLRFTDDIVTYLTRKNIYAMAYKEWEYMDILNFEELK